MKILFLTHHSYPHIGGVEKHVGRLRESLIKKGHEVTVVSQEDVKFPHKKIIGLLHIWKWFWRNRRLIKESDIVHCHDVFIWYLPFRFIFPFKKVFTTFHGWEGVYPIPFKNILLKQLANKLSNKTIVVGKYIEKYYGIKANKVIYGGVDTNETSKITKVPKTMVFLGRLEKDTGILEFLEWIKVKGRGFSIDFIGDGSLREECSKFGRVLGFIDPIPFLERSQYCVPGGYLSYIEASSHKCKIMTFANNSLKEDYWDEIKKVKKFPTWDALAYEYIRLYNSSK